MAEDLQALWSCANAPFNKRLADTIEKDSSGNWGDIFADECRTEYMRRELSFETAMDSEWKAAHAEINLIDVKYSWNL